MHQAAAIAIAGLTCRGPEAVEPRLLPGEPVVVHHATSAFGDLYVVDEGELRSLRWGAPDGPEQTIVDREDPAAVPMDYLHTAALGAFLAGRSRRALLVGLGGGGFVRVLRGAFPGIVIEAVEIDPVVVDLAQRFFDLHEGPDLRVHVDDAAAHLRDRGPPTRAESFDIVLLDAYSGDQIPEQLAERTFLEDVRDRIHESGVVIANLSMEARAYGRMATLFAEVFRGGCMRLHTPVDENVVLVGARRALPLRDELVALAEALARRQADGALVLAPSARTRRECSNTVKSSPWDR